MDEITYDNVVDMEEFKNKKRINTDDLPRLTAEQAKALFPPNTTAYLYNPDFPEKGIVPYSTIFGMEEFRDKKRKDTPVYKLIRECEAVLEKEIQEREEAYKKRREDLMKTGHSFTKINFNPFNGLPVTTLLTYEDVFGKIPGTDDPLPPAS